MAPNEQFAPCPWSVGSDRKRFYRPDWIGAPDCSGCEGCMMNDSHQCHVFGLIGMCTWPNPIVAGNFRVAYWRPELEAGLAEGWLLPPEWQS